MDNRILFDELVKEGIVSGDVSGRILTEAAVNNRNAEEILYERRLADEEAVVKVKSRLLGIPWKKVSPESIPPEAVKVIPEETVRNYKIVPIERTPEMLIAGMFDPDDLRGQEILRFIAKQLKVNLGVYLITYSDWERVLRHYSPYESEVSQFVKTMSLKSGGGLPEQRITRLEEGLTVSEEAPIIKIVASTLKEAVWRKASDIHIEPQRQVLRIRFRVDGELMVTSTMPLDFHQPIISRIKVLSNLKLDETRIPQDGRFRTVIFGRDIDFRVSTFPTAVGEKAAIRVLDPTVGLKGLEELGLLERNMDILKKGIERPYGMVLLTGPTGSGKTTTLYALMQILNKDNVNIVSLEDPVEYFIEGLNQSQIRPEINYDFSSGLRQILRQDPDVIMVGEIRDEETASLAVHASLTGHVVLTTLHTNNSLGVIPRLIDMKVEPFLLPSALNLMAAQRLVSRLCVKCRKAAKAPAAAEEIIAKEFERLPAEIKEGLKNKTKNGFMIYHAPGCEACNGKGVSGRIALFEIFEMTPQLEEVILSGPTEAKIYEEARRQGMINLRQDGIIKALEGIVSLEEILKETEEI